MHHSARIASLLVIAALLVASCGGTGTPSATGSAGASAAAASATPRPPKDQVKLPSVVSTELNLASLIAYAKDYFGEENIEVTDFVLGSSSTLRAAMIAKEYDFGLFAFVHDPIARIAGSPWKMVIATYDREIFSLLVRTQLKDSVKAVADLKGKNVGVTGAGSGSWARRDRGLGADHQSRARDERRLRARPDLGPEVTSGVDRIRPRARARSHDARGRDRGEARPREAHGERAQEGARPHQDERGIGAGGRDPRQQQDGGAVRGARQGARGEAHRAHQARIRVGLPVEVGF
ncbi:MAG: hypothetical protein E6J19_00670 [Chloroflexi bacterium]|nr:MAG: hypothetical protein E6J19_00670 [Chloroflexota bacterium]